MFDETEYNTCKNGCHSPDDQVSNDETRTASTMDSLPNVDIRLPSVVGGQRANGRAGVGDGSYRAGDPCDAQLH